MKATILSRFSSDPSFPRPLGILYASQRATYEELLHDQKTKAMNQAGQTDLFTLFKGKNSWEVN